jgi:hypothetical protein
MISVKGLNKRVDRLLKQADKIQEEYKKGEYKKCDATEKELRKMERMYLEASTITITLEAVKNDIVKLIDS